MHQVADGSRGVFLDSIEGLKYIAPGFEIKTSFTSPAIGEADEATPTKKAKPAGVMGAKIWVKIGDPPPTDPTDLGFLAVDTPTPYSTHYAGGDANKTAH